jgi:hypothetical protein
MLEIIGMGIIIASFMFIAGMKYSKAKNLSGFNPGLATNTVSYFDKNHESLFDYTNYYFDALKRSSAIYRSSIPDTGKSYFRNEEIVTVETIPTKSISKNHVTPRMTIVRISGEK